MPAPNGTHDSVDRSRQIGMAVRVKIVVAGSALPRNVRRHRRLGAAAITVDLVHGAARADRVLSINERGSRPVLVRRVWARQPVTFAAALGRRGAQSGAAAHVEHEARSITAGAERARNRGRRVRWRTTRKCRRGRARCSGPSSPRWHGTRADTRCPRVLQTGVVNGRGSVDALHRSTMHGEPPAHGDRLLAFRPLDPTNRPAPLKTYTGVETVPLPGVLRPSSLPAVEVLSGHHAEPGRLDDSLLGTLLFLAAGVTRFTRTVDGDPIWFRSAMSAGNLHPVEVYVVGDDVHHYHPLVHALVPLRRGVHVCDDVTLVLTGIPFRTCWKYGERGWRHLWWDAGALLANLLAAADAHGVPAQIIAGFPDAAVAALVGIDGVDEVPLALVRLGSGELRLPPPDALEPVAARADPVARRVLRFPLVVDAHTDTALDVDAVAGWQQAAAGGLQAGTGDGRTPSRQRP